jgi:hypothetical protein
MRNLGRQSCQRCNYVNHLCLAYSSLEETCHDQPTKCQEKSTEETKSNTNDGYKNSGNGDADIPQITTEKEIPNVNHVLKIYTRRIWREKDIVHRGQLNASIDPKTK